MQPIQIGEQQSRLRRLTNTVGQQTLVLEEVASPIIVLDSIAGPPWRSDPRRLGGFQSIAPAAIAGGNGRVILVFPSTGMTDGAFVVRQIDLMIGGLSTNVRIDNNVQLGLRLHVAQMTAPIATAPNLFSMEPVGSAVAGGIGLNLTAQTGAAGITNERQVGQWVRAGNTSADQDAITVHFRDLDILLVPMAKSDGVQFAVIGEASGTSSAGVNNVGCAMAVRGDLYQRYPLR
jgi:hypothetical protein